KCRGSQNATPTLRVYVFVFLDHDGDFPARLQTVLFPPFSPFLRPVVLAMLPQNAKAEEKSPGFCLRQYIPDML
ncbi:MAG TPA: hypothetical protein DCF33_09155, partial [Saprospirales bacterium]|nr:hypothetical protein [Saprospirales bacterium]